MASARTASHAANATTGTRGPESTPSTAGAPSAAGTAGAPARARKESLADVLRRRSSPGEVARQERTAAVQFSLAALTRSAAGALEDVPLDELHANPFQRRFRFNRQRLEELAQSLAAEGQLEPVIARRVTRGRGCGTRRFWRPQTNNMSVTPRSGVTDAHSMMYCTIRPTNCGIDCTLPMLST